MSRAQSGGGEGRVRWRGVQAGSGGGEGGVRWRGGRGQVAGSREQRSHSPSRPPFEVSRLRTLFPQNFRARSPFLSCHPVGPTKVCGFCGQRGPGSNPSSPLSSSNSLHPHVLICHTHTKTVSLPCRVTELGLLSQSGLEDHAAKWVSVRT